MPGSPFTIFDGPTVIRQQGTMTGGGDSVGGITVTGTPTANQVLTATSATAANWQAGGGGSVPFPAQAGSGPPGGAVTPTGVGSLYVDTDSGGLWIADGATDADWIAVGGVTLTGGAVGVLFNGMTRVSVTADGGGGGQVGLTDALARAGSGNGLFWLTTGSDGAQELSLFIGAGGAFEHDWLANGVYDCSGAKGIKLPTSNPHIAGVLWNNAGTPAISAG